MSTEPQAKEAYDRVCRLYDELDSPDSPDDPSRLYVEAVKELYWRFVDIPASETEIELPFLHFEAGTDPIEVMRWFEEELNVSVAYLQGHNVHPITGKPNEGPDYTFNDWITVLENEFMSFTGGYTLSDLEGFVGRGRLIEMYERGLLPDDAILEIQKEVRGIFNL